MQSHSGWYRSVLSLMLAAAVSGCMRRSPESPLVKAPEIKAIHATAAIVTDGELSEEIWQKAPAYDLCAMPGAAGLLEHGRVQFAWDDQCLYMAVRFDDSDVVATGNADNLPHFELGDLAELFIGSAQDTWYYELYVTPQSRQTSYFFAGPGRRFSSCMLATSMLKVAAHVDGSLNQWRDRDRGWLAEMAIPWSALREADSAAGPATPWRVLVARYNYSRYLPATELASYPALKAVNFHVPAEYATLRLLP